MPALVNPFVEIGKLEGLQEGIEKGRAEGERDLVFRQLKLKFPKAAAGLEASLEGLDEERLLSFGEALLFFETEGDCLAWFDRE